MNATVELHAHTDRSDGTDTPAALVARGLRAELRWLAVTDHDTVDGARAAEKAACGTCLRVIPGVELSARHGSESVHVLGYFVDPAEPTLETALVRLRSARLERNVALGLTLARDVSILLDMAAVSKRCAIPPDHLGTRHFVRAASAVLSCSRSEAVRVIEEHAAHVPARAKPSVGECVEIIRRAGGVAVLAHPAVSLAPRTRAATVAAARDHGIDGIEVTHPGHTEADTAELREVARELGLVATGGSDFHGERKPGRDLGMYARCPEASEHTLQALFARRPS